MQDAATESPASTAGCLTRLCWMFLGNATVLFLLLAIAERNLAFPSLMDAACLAAIAFVIACRYIDIRFLAGQTADGKPASMTDWRRHTLIVSTLGASAWAAVRMYVLLRQ